MGLYNFRISWQRMLQNIRTNAEMRRMRVVRTGGSHLGGSDYRSRRLISVILSFVLLVVVFIPKDGIAGKIAVVVALIACIVNAVREIMSRKGRKRWLFLSVVSLSLGVAFAIMCLLFMFADETPDMDMLVFFVPLTVAFLLFPIFAWRRYRRLRTEAEVRVWMLRQQRNRQR